MTTTGVSGWMFLLVAAHPGCPEQNPKSRKTVVCVCKVIWLISVLCCVVIDECLSGLKTRLSGSKSDWPVRKDLLEFNRRYESIMSWLMQKEKMASLLVPVGCQLPVLSNQLMQTKVSWCSILACYFVGFSMCVTIVAIMIGRYDFVQWMHSIDAVS